MTVGGRLDYELLMHRPPGAAQIRDARDHARRSLSALRAIDAASLRGDTFAAVGRAGALLVDLVQELDRLERQMHRGQP